MTFRATSNFSKGLRCLETRRYRTDFDFGKSRRSLAAKLSEQGDVFAIKFLKVKTLFNLESCDDEGTNCAARVQAYFTRSFKQPRRNFTLRHLICFLASSEQTRNRTLAAVPLDLRGYVGLLSFKLSTFSRPFLNRFSHRKRRARDHSGNFITTNILQGLKKLYISPRTLQLFPDVEFTIVTSPACLHFSPPPVSASLVHY